MKQGQAPGSLFNVGFLTTALAGVIAMSTANASPTKELLVRVKKGNHQLMLNQFSNSSLVNSNEGLLKLRFNSAEEAKAAQEKLKNSENVLSVSPNLHYRPAIHYRFKEVSGMAFATPKDTTFTGFPWGSWQYPQTQQSKTTMPDVLPPLLVTTKGSDPLVASDWALKNINMAGVKPIKPAAGKNIVTAVIDTGVDYNHEDLRNAMWRKPNNQAVVGYDFAHMNAKPYDLRHFDLDGCIKDAGCAMGNDDKGFLANPGHGTHCAGHVAAVFNNAIGMAGVAAGTRIMALKFFYDYGEVGAGQGDDAGAIQAIDYAIANGARVISASWGGRQEPLLAQLSELRLAMERAQKAGVLFVVAAGNDGINQDTDKEPSFPAAYDYDNMIVVAASDQNDLLADFSNYGDKSVHIAAPGVKILSTIAGGGYSDVVSTFTAHNGNIISMDWDGTSMATPIVAGAAAAIWAKYPSLDYKEVKRRILDSARRVPGLKGKVTTGAVLDVATAIK